MSTKQDTHKILLVDDDKDMCESLADVLTLDSDYSVSFTTNPTKALELVKVENFSLIVIDFKMPEMNGLELLKRLKMIKPAVKVFILTAFISNELNNPKLRLFKSLCCHCGERSSEAISPIVTPAEAGVYKMKTERGH
jgi:CheY-like chemotaxis protein